MSYIAKEVMDILKQPLQQFAERSKKITVKLCKPGLDPASILQLHPDLSENPTNKVANCLADKYKDGRQICQSWVMLASQIYEVEDPDGFAEWAAFHGAIGIESEDFLHRIGEIFSAPDRYSPF
ncbi:MAG: hypothetical protein F6K10_36620 [Moorea sp. SIO2B7]|nr:hypothetical protein [Moorena sp. SIO2B7]